MPSLLAIISRKVFEREGGAGLGSVYATGLYRSKHRKLAPLEAGGALFLVTVRPPGERLWLVAVLDDPKRTDEGWRAGENVMPITDISALRSKLRFTTGKGVSLRSGALGMSLQTPRELTAADLTLLRDHLASAPTPVTERTTAGTIVWDDEAEKYLRARAADELKPAKSPRSLWTAWRKERDGARFSVEGSDEGLLSVAETVRAFFTDPGEPGAIDVAHAAAMLRWAAGAKGVAYLCARFEPLFALRALIDSHEIDFAYGRGNTYPLVARPPEEARSIFARPLADSLLRGEETARAACDQIAEAAWNEAAPPLRVSLLSAFPDRDDWAAAIAPAYVAGPVHDTDLGRLLIGSIEDLSLADGILGATHVSANCVELVRTFGEDAAPMIVERFETTKESSDRRHLARALALIGTREVAEVFARNLRITKARPFASSFFARHPELAKAVLPSHAAKKTKAAQVARELLERVARAADAPPPEEVGEEADADALPSVLVSSPWRVPPRQRPKRRRLRVGKVDLPRVPTRLHWTEAARRRWLAAIVDEFEPDDESTREVLAKCEAGQKAYFRLNLREDVALRLWNAPPPSLLVLDAHPAMMLARYGQAALPGVLLQLERRVPFEAHLLPMLFGVESPRVARSLAGPLGSPWNREIALGWIARFPKTATLGLVPAAVCEARGQERDGAELGLRHLVRLGHDEIVRGAARSFGERVNDAVDEILSWDERWDAPKKAPKMPSGYRPAELRRPRLRDGRALPIDAVRRLGEMLRFSDPGYPYAGILDVIEACEPRSLAEHAWDLAKTWEIDGGRDAQRWMLDSLACLADDEVVRRTTPALKSPLVVEVLTRIGTDAAVMELATIAARRRRKAYRSFRKSAVAVEGSLRHLATLRGHSVDELEERFTPTCDVDERGRLPIDFGGRRFEIAFDEHLQINVRNAAGERLPKLPRARAGDDPEKARAAHVIWTDLAEDVSVIAERRAAALERALVDGREWELRTYQRIWVDHPLMFHLARGVVWEQGERRFRVAEDRTFANADDEELELSEEGGSVRVAHPATWSADERGKWREIFADYRIVPPFEQLGREPIELEPGEAERQVIERARPVDLEMLGERLRRLGFLTRRRRGVDVSRAIGDLFAHVSVPDEADRVRVRIGRIGSPITFGELDPVTRTELLRIARG